MIWRKFTRKYSKPTVVVAGKVLYFCKSVDEIYHITDEMKIYANIHVDDERKFIGFVFSRYYNSLIMRKVHKYKAGGGFYLCALSLINQYNLKGKYELLGVTHDGIIYFKYGGEDDKKSQ